MSNNVSENTATQVVESVTSVINSATQTCQNVIDQNQIVTITAGSGSNVDVNLTGKQVVSFNAECSQTAVVQSNITNSISQEAQQQAAVIEQQFDLSIGNRESKNVYNSLVSLSSKVVNAFNQECLNIISQNQNFTIDVGADSNVQADINWDQTLKTTVDCIMNTKAVNGVVNDVKQSIDQSAKVSVENFFAFLIYIAIAIVAVVALIIFALLGFGVIGAAGKSGSSGKTTSTYIIPQTS